MKNRPSAIIPPSTIDSYGRVTNINKLLNSVLSPQKSAETATATPTFSYFDNLENSNSSVIESGKNKQKTAELPEKLASLSSFANIGTAETTKWQYKGISGTEIGQKSTSINDSSNELEVIADLERKIADAQRLANLGEARLNKWRSRTFF